MEVFNTLDIGKRVWSGSGYRDHGPVDGFKTNIPAETGGEIISLTRPYSTMDVFLYEVKWDSGESSKHYYKELESIGSCKDFSDYEKILISGKNAKLTLGPRGGFKKFEMIVQHNNTEYIINLNSEQSMCWQGILNVLKINNISFETETLAIKRSSK